MLKKPTTHLLIFVLTLIYLFILSSLYGGDSHISLEGIAKWNTILFFAMVILGFLSLLYQFFFSLSLICNEQWREAIFLTFTRSHKRDELEEKALNDAIKRSFLLNISVLVMLFILTDVAIQVTPVSLGEGEATAEIKASLNAAQAEKLGIKYLIPKDFYNRNTIFCYLLFQLLCFRFFLYLNHRKLELV